MQRRDFLQFTLSSSTLFFGLTSLPFTSHAAKSSLISPGCRKSKVKIARLFLGKPEPHWPHPTLDLQAEQNMYEQEFARMQQDFADVEFTVTQLLSAPEEIDSIAASIVDADGILVIQLTIGTGSILEKILTLKKPTVLFAAPYSGHEWVRFGSMMQGENGKYLECLLTSDTSKLAEAIRPIRAIHHFREAKILNVTSRRMNPDYVQAVQKKFGTILKPISREQMLEAYNSISDEAARAETQEWIQNAIAVVEPSEDEIFRSCKLALAFEQLLNEEEATVITVDCYGSMYRQLPAFPCIGFTRLNDMGYGGICESDLQCAMTHILLQSISGKPGFISDPTMDVSRNATILAHCLGTRCMDGPDGAIAPYKLRTIMERQEGAVPQVFMRNGEKVTQALLVQDQQLLYFTGTVIEVPDTERGCRTKITVQVDGDAEQLWKNWSNGLHRVTCYGDITQDLKRFCRLMEIDFKAEV
ncbi:MAG: hypothetical protein ACOX5R_12695 [bacterium]